ncbi:ACP S-malonyltransferase [Parendozoicomonas haliclonae]|uniref:Malonyl CoA-acyl carrier protein transacylase n=1 Tax=Parendozoicomonas haliclonae TaxID=1960125 RepID=A0A1X7AMK0_9GAMM|nr:ACP S-malonyltransferase [Parendozoicomonas haliclonae]SMA49163.1 Malonyl CoA-acyl carrier protein transacylase [Parendozoicomonas haliclonae]
MSTSTAFIFPGQGSQSVGMLADIADVEPVVNETLVEASDVLGFDLRNMILNGPAEQLNSTQNTQPALLAGSIALWRLWSARGGQVPAYVAGHSLGEYSALVAAGVIEFADAVRIVHNRGLYMQEAVPQGEGAMAAVLGLDDDKVIALCAETAHPGEVLSAVNFNSPGQVVIAGSASAVKRAVETFSAAGARKVMPLPVSVPSHCALMEPAAVRLEQDLAGITFSVPQIPVVQNVSAAIVTDVNALRANLVDQLSQPVRWVESVQLMIANGVDQFYECGPGKVLAGLSKRIDRSATVTPLESLSAFPMVGEG